jgi:hypothetical protein
LHPLTEQQAQAATSLFVEIDQLSFLSEGLDQQAKKKALDPAAPKEKLRKAAHQVLFLFILCEQTDGFRRNGIKQKTEAENIQNKYFAAVRESG